jgi:peptide/nickel transport system substrate-binding protein
MGLAGLAASALAACGSGNASAGSGSTSSTLTFAVPEVPPQIDPAVWSGAPNDDLGPAFAGTLVSYVPTSQNQHVLDGPANLQPELAQSYVENPNGSYTFTLRKTESPNGDPLTSADVKWSLQRAAAIAPIPEFLMGLGDINLKDPVTIINSHKFILNVTGRTALTLVELQHYSLGILDMKVAKEHATAKDPWAKAWLATHSASFGPYSVSEFQPNVRLQLTGNSHFHAPGAPYYKKVIISAVSDSATRLELLKSGSVDMTDYLDFSQFKTLGSEGVTLYSNRRDVLALSSAYKPFADPRVRLAISMAINRSAIAAGPYAGYATPALWPQSSAYPQPTPPNSDMATYNPTEAKRLLTEAGYPHGFSFTLSVAPTWSGNQVQAVAILLQSELAKIGLHLSISTIASTTTFQTDRSSSKLQAWIDLEAPIVNDMSFNFFLNYTNLSGADDVVGYNNPALNSDAKAMLGQLATSQRSADELKADQILTSDPGWLGIVQVPFQVGIKSKICGLWPDPERIVEINLLHAC